MIDRPWWKRAPIDRRGVALLVGAYVVLTTVYCLVGEAIVRWWDGSRWGDADVAVNRWFEDARTPTWTELAHLGSALSNTETKIVLALGLLPVMLALYRRWHDWSLLAVGLLLEVSIFATTATVVGRARPPVEQLDGAPTDSWPSGHIAAATVFYIGVATVIWWNNPRRWGRAAAVAVGVSGPTMVILSRLYLGMHHPTDVVGGVVLGLVTLGLVRHVLRRTAGDRLERPLGDVWRDRVTSARDGDAGVSFGPPAGSEVVEGAVLARAGGLDEGNPR